MCFAVKNDDISCAYSKLVVQVAQCGRQIHERPIQQSSNYVLWTTPRNTGTGPLGDIFRLMIALFVDG